MTRSQRFPFLQQLVTTLQVEENQNQNLTAQSCQVAAANTHFASRNHFGSQCAEFYRAATDIGFLYPGCASLNTLGYPSDN